MAKTQGVPMQDDESSFLTKDLKRRIRRSGNRSTASATPLPPKHDMHTRKTPGHTAFTPPKVRSTCSNSKPTVRIIMGSGSVHAVGSAPGKERVIDYRQVMIA